MFLKNLTYEEAREHDLLSPGTLWIRRNTDYRTIGEIVNIEKTKDISNDPKYYIYFSGISNLYNNVFFTRFTPYYGTKRVTENDKEWLIGKGILNAPTHNR